MTIYGFFKFEVKTMKMISFAELCCKCNGTCSDRNKSTKCSAPYATHVKWMMKS